MTSLSLLVERRAKPLPIEGIEHAITSEQFLDLPALPDAFVFIGGADAILGTAGDAELPDVDYSAVPSILFTYPQYGMVGVTEDALKKQGIPFTKSFGKNLTWPTYRRIGMTQAAYKILVGNDR